MHLRHAVENNEVRFRRYQGGIAFYGLRMPDDGKTYEFPVPLREVGSATLLPRERAMSFWRFIQRAETRGVLNPVD